MSAPIICFGQQPCGIFPRRFLFAKIQTARRLQSEIGGEIVFFFHDSDHDPRETITVLAHRQTGALQRLNFEVENRIQKQYSPLFAKRLVAGWQEKTARQLPQFAPHELVEHFKAITADIVSDFCLQMYGRMGLLDDITIMRSGDRGFREQAVDVDDYFVDVTYENELVRARVDSDCLKLHKGGNAFIHLPLEPHAKAQISPTRDTRLRWMQSVIGCTHYVTGAGELQYLNTADAPDVHFVTRDAISESDRAYVPDA